MGAPALSAAGRVRSALIALAAVAALVIAAGIVVVVGSDLLTCSSPSEKALQAQEAFVLSRVPNARDVEVGTRDCDDNGDGYVYFTTDLTPAGARDAFLADQSCTPYTEDKGEEVAVECTSEKSTVYVSFRATDEDPTTGELDLS